MNYDEWINRERRIRIKILRDSPVIKERGVCRICCDCAEVCLCHEEFCPNCNSNNISGQPVANIDGAFAVHIRCRYRFKNLTFKNLVRD